MKRHPFVEIPLVLVLSLVACDSEPRETATDLGDPLQRAFAVDASAAVEANELRDRSIVDCMESAGFEFVPTVASFPERLRSVDELVVAHVDDVEEHGYGIVRRARRLVERPANPNQKIIESLSVDEQTRYHDRMYGDHGCVASARQAVAERFPDVVLASGTDNPIDDALEQFESAMLTNGQGVFGRWSDCMEAAGYEFRTPFAARASVLEQLDSPGDSSSLDKLQTLEIEIALADADCQTSHGGEIERLSHDIQRDLFGTVISRSSDG